MSLDLYEPTARLVFYCCILAKVHLLIRSTLSSLSYIFKDYQRVYHCAFFIFHKAYKI